MYVIVNDIANIVIETPTAAHIPGENGRKNVAMFGVNAGDLMNNDVLEISVETIFKKSYIASKQFIFSQIFLESNHINSLVSGVRHEK